jgi:hypothetical protein
MKKLNFLKKLNKLSLFAVYICLNIFYYKIIQYDIYNNKFSLNNFKIT